MTQHALIVVARKGVANEMVDQVEIIAIFVVSDPIGQQGTLAHPAVAYDDEMGIG